MDSYHITLTQEKAGTYRLVTILVSIINCLVLGKVYLDISDSRSGDIALIGLIVAIAGLAFFILNHYTRFKSSFRIEISFIITAICWIVLGKILVAAFLILFAVLGIYTNRKPIIYISEKGIQYPSFPPKTLTWKEVEAVILKDGILTIDLKNNQLFQLNVPFALNNDLNETVFNKTCQSFISRIAAD